jgi:hypothetical protein
MTTASVLAVALGPAGGASATSPAGYVALGDSYASGPLIPDQVPDPVACLRSDHDYPHVVAASLGLQLTDESCSGATTASVESPESVAGGSNPAQIDGLNDATAVVSITLGGDDLGFVSLIEHCLALSPLGPTRVGRTCRAHYDGAGGDQLARAITALAPKEDAVLQAIRAAAPSAKVFVVGYPDILPTGTGCWPTVPFTRADVPYLRATELELDQMLRTDAAANHDVYVDTYTPSESHTACGPAASRWVEALVPHSLAAPFHPNASGEAALGGLVEQAMRADGVR